MAITVTHSKVSTIPDDADTSLIRPSDWNDDHVLTGLGTIAEQNANAVAITGGTASNLELTNPEINQINDTNGNEILGLSPTASATDFLTVKNGIGVGVPLHVYADGSSTNVGLHIQPKGSGLVTISDGTDFNKGIRFRSSSSAASAITLLDAVSSAGRVVTLPDATTTLVGRDTTDTLTNKSISGSTNTLTNIANASLTNSAITINGTSTSLGGSINVGTVTSVTGTSPVVSSGGNTPAISMPAATASVNGYLTSTDWSTFNGKGSGTVTSVALTAPSIFTVTGSPVTSTGTLALTYSGTALPILNGGTGQTTANAAFNALAPSQTSNSGKYLTTDGTSTSWATISGTSYSRTSFTATAAQTTFTVAYTVGLIQVYVNGVLLNGSDYTATNGTSVVLAVACNAGDIVEALAFTSFAVASTVSSFSAGTTGLTPSTGTTGNVTLGGTLAVANGGTGVTTSTGTGAVVLGTSPTLSSPTINTPIMGGSVITSGTAQASTSGTTIPFTGIPSWVKRITVMFNAVSTSGTSFVQVQIGSTTYTTSGYVSSTSTNGANGSSTTGFIATVNSSAADVRTGLMTITNLSGNIWVMGANIGSTFPNCSTSMGVVTLSGVLDRVRVTTINGTDTFDAGSINILYE